MGIAGIECGPLHCEDWWQTACWHSLHCYQEVMEVNTLCFREETWVTWIMGPVNQRGECLLHCLSLEISHWNVIWHFPSNSSSGSKCVVIFVALRRLHNKNWMLRIFFTVVNACIIIRIIYLQIRPHTDYIQTFVLLVEKTTRIEVGALLLLSK